MIRLVSFGLIVGSLFASAEGRADLSIVLGDAATAPEQHAAQELADYLGKVTGATVVVTPESGVQPAERHIYVGATQFAKLHGLDVAALGPEEWMMRTVGSDLMLAGGRPRGTLYAAYHFLEDVAGVHWWNPFEETVPKNPALSFGTIDRKGKPTFRYRDIYLLYANDGGHFAARNRLNRQGDYPIGAECGGEVGYGPPAHVHTFYTYMSPEVHFQDHPEWYSLIDGKRTTDNAQLCLTNVELRKVFLEKLRAFIEQARAAAQQTGQPAPYVFDVSQNDCGGMCQCDSCQAIAKAEESEAGPILDFVNYLADAIKAESPDVCIDTLAYSMTQKPPKTIKPRDNVVIRLCDTGSNFTKPITDAENLKFHDHLSSWATIAKNLRIWNYAVSYAPHYGLPMPTVHTYPINYRFYAEHNVEGVFTEHEYPILADLRDFKVWMMMKELEDPYQDYAALVRTFTDGFYGPAGPYFRDYLDRLEKASAAKSSYLSMDASPKQYRYLDLAFMVDAQALFDQAEKAVGDDAVLLRRVRHARLPLDRATLVLYTDLQRAWVRDNHDPATNPLNRDAIAARCRDTWYAQAGLRFPEAEQVGVRAEADAELQPLVSQAAYVPLPEQFKNVPPGTLFDFLAGATRNWNDEAKRVQDAEAESGVANRLELSDEDMKKYALPMPWGLYDRNSKQGSSAQIKPEDVPGPGYHWYKLGNYPVAPSMYLYFFWSWIIQVDLGGAVDSAHPEQPFEVWARIKFEGPGFPHGKPEQKNAICVERVILIKAG
ncbi:MAG: DUF4838 domain-containing protein [Candidatus Hydrogenedentales bacterium]|jgi:hypothetical protein